MSTKSQGKHIKIHLDDFLTGEQYKGCVQKSKWNRYEKGRLAPAPDATMTNYPDDFNPREMVYATFNEFTFGDMNGDIRVMEHNSLYSHSNQKISGKSVEAAVFYNDHILVADNSGTITWWNVDDEKFIATTVNIDAGDRVRQMLYNEIDDRVYVIGKKKIYVINDTTITDGIVYTTKEHTSLRKAAIYRNYIVVTAYSYETKKSYVLFWDRKTTSTTWQKEITFSDSYVSAVASNNNTLYIVERHTITSTNVNQKKKYIMKYYNGGSFQEVKNSSYNLLKGNSYLSSLTATSKGIVGIGQAPTSGDEQETKEVGLVFFDFQGGVYEYGNINLSTKGAFLALVTGTFAYNNSYPIIALQYYDLEASPRTFKWHKFRVESGFTKTSFYTTRFIGDNYNLVQPTEFYITYPRLTDGMKIKVSYRISHLDDWTELIYINDTNQSSATDINTDLFRTKVKSSDLPKFQRIQFKYESLGGAWILSSGLWVNEHNYE